MKTVAIVQARMGSTRLPNKVMKLIGGTPMIGILLLRLSRSKRIDEIIVATSEDQRNKPLVEYVQSLGYSVFRGSENDVLDRYYQAATLANATRVLRITGDCPLIDATLVDQIVDAYDVSGVDYISNTDPPTYPDGLDTEVFSYTALKRAWEETRQIYDREHVTPYIRSSGHFSVMNIANETDISDERWTVDTADDFAVITGVFDALGTAVNFTWRDVLSLRRRAPEIFAANKTQIRNEGASMGKGQKLWSRAKQIIPGGNMLLSKRAEMFMPEQWPAYFSKSKGFKVWDLDGNEYIDMTLMGVGTNILGYGHPEVDEAVMEVVKNGNMSTLNAPEEVYLAEKLIDLHPFAEMVRFARSGGEANAIAVRIARAAAGKDNVAVCGYHGWHDWYLSANLGEDESLAGHLLPGLEPNGVPRNLRGTVYPFNYNDFNMLETLIAERNIGVIKMEVVRNKGPEGNFLNRVRELATKNGIVLIFDECTSGFRETFGGLYKKYGVEPDIAVFGKTLGNGYAVTATIGKRSIMEAAQTTFISSTFWTERVGSAAAVKTLEVMEREKPWERITQIGADVTQRWKKLAEKYGLSISTAGLPSLTTYSFNSANAMAYKTLITQEMLAKGFLASTNFYASIAHTPDVIDAYFEALDPIYAKIRECEDGRDIVSLLKGPVCHAGFRRLN